MQNRPGTALVSGRHGAWASPIEEIVDAHRHHLDVAVSGKGVAREDRRCGRNREGSAAQPDIIVLGPDGPVVREGPFESGARRPTAVGIVARAGNGQAARHVGDGEAAVSDPGTAGLAVKQYAIPGDAKPAREGVDPTIVDSYREGMSQPQRTRNDNPTGGIIVVCGQIEVEFGAQHEIVDLVVE